MKTLITPLAVALLILTLVSCQNDTTTQPPPKTGGDTTIILSIDTLTDTVSMPLCPYRGGMLLKDSLLIGDDSNYQIFQKVIKNDRYCKDFIYTEVDFTQYDLLWMRHSINSHDGINYSLIRNDSIKEYLSISEGYIRGDSLNSDAVNKVVHHLYRVPKLRSDYTVRFIFHTPRK